jgi:hypothetical protein
MKRTRLIPLAGFLVTFAASCLMASIDYCDGANCEGCCNNGTCVKPPNNSNNTTCGTRGDACVDCTHFGRMCYGTFTCVDAGTP